MSRNLLFLTFFLVAFSFSNRALAQHAGPIRAVSAGQTAKPARMGWADFTVYFNGVAAALPKIGAIASATVQWYHLPAGAQFDDWVTAGCSCYVVYFETVGGAIGYAQVSASGELLGWDIFTDGSSSSSSSSS